MCVDCNYSVVAFNFTWLQLMFSFKASFMCIYMSIYSVITRVLIARTHRWDLNGTRWYRFKLNSCKLCQFKHLRARGCELAHAVRRFVRALVRSVQTACNNKEITHCSWLNCFFSFSASQCQNVWNSQSKCRRRDLLFTDAELRATWMGAEVKCS